MRQDFLYVVEEAHVQHLVGFVENHRADVVELHLPALDEVDEASRSGHHHLHAFSQSAYLALYARTAVDRENPHPVDVFGEIGKVAGYLETQFTGRRDYKRLGDCMRSVGALQHRDAESRSLAGAGLRKAHHIAVLVQQMGYHHPLYGHRMHESKLLHCLQYRRLYAEIVEIVLGYGYARIVAFICILLHIVRGLRLSGGQHVRVHCLGGYCGYGLFWIFFFHSWCLGIMAACASRHII